MSSNSEQTDHNMVDTLTTIFKKVRFFGYNTADLDPSLDYPSSFDEVQEPEVNVSPILMAQPTAFTHIQYDDSDFSNSLASTSSLSSSFGCSPSLEPLTHSNYLENFSDKEFDLEETPRLDNIQPNRRRRPTGVHEERVPALPEYSLNEVAQHDTMHDCWMILYDKVSSVVLKK